MTPEEIARRNAARTSAGELGEVVARAKPAVYVDSKGTASVGTQPTGTAMTVRKPSQALATKPGQALATTAQPIPSEVRSTAKPVPGRPGPTITVDSKGVASTLEQRTGQVAAQRMAAERAARIAAMQSGGVGALNETIARQTGTNPATGRAVPPAGAAPAAAPVKPAAAPPAAAKPAAPGQPRVGSATSAGVVAPVAMFSAAQSGMTPTEQYYERLMIDPKSRPFGAGARDLVSDALGIGEEGRQKFENAAEFGRDVTARTIGGLSDLGANILDMGTAVWNTGSALVGAEQIPTFNEMLRSNETERPRGSTPLGQMIDSAAGQAAGMVDRVGPQDPPARSAPDPGEQAAGQPAGDRVLGTFNGQQITESQARELAGRNVVATPQPAAGEPRAAVPASRGDDGQGQLLAMLNQARGDRQGVQEGANARLKDLYSRFNDLMSRGKRRSAAVVGDLIGRELGVIQGTAQGQMIDPRRPGQNPADDQRTQALTEGVQLDNRAKRLAQQSLEAYLADPTSEAGQQALARYQSIAGGKQNQEYVYERLMTPEGGESIVAINKANPGDARVVQPQQTPQQLIAEAQAAIAAGAPRDAVIAELKARGINL